MSEVVRVPINEPMVPAPPRRSDGDLYRFELVEPEGRWRAYSDDASLLVGELIQGYVEADEAIRGRARRELAVYAQVVTQALVVVDRGTDGCSADDLAILEGMRDEQPRVDLWTAPVPLLLVEDYYAPAGVLPRPLIVEPGEVIWIGAGSDESLLRSLHRIGWLTLAEASAG